MIKDKPITKNEIKYWLGNDYPKWIANVILDLVNDNDPKAKINRKTKMLEICINKNGSVEHINGLPKGYGYYVKRIK